MFLAGSAVDPNTVLTPPYFNIAENRKVSANATCGEGTNQREMYCKLVGYDRIDAYGSIGGTDIIDGQVHKVKRLGNLGARRLQFFEITNFGQPKS